MRMFFKQYVKEMSQLGVDSIGIVLLISFFIGAVICIQIKLNVQSPWMPHWVSGYVTREIMLLEFSSSIMCLILAGKVGSNIASELGTMRVTQQIDALEIMGINSASYLILPKIAVSLPSCLFGYFLGGDGCDGSLRHSLFRAYYHPADLTSGIQHSFNPWFMYMSIIKGLFFALHHCQRVVILWLFGERRIGRCGCSIDRCRGELKRSDSLQRRVPDTDAELKTMLRNS